jgi:hypothetical protein
MQMKRTSMLFLLFLTLPPDARAQTGFDRRQVEREVMSVLDAILDAFNRQDARAEERTYQFPHYRLANGLMSVLSGPGSETETWMEGTYKTMRESGWDHSSWTRRRIVHISDTKAHVDTEITRYRKDGTVMARLDSLYIVTKENGRWGIKMRSSFDTVIAAPGDHRNSRVMPQHIQMEPTRLLSLRSCRRGARLILDRLSC